MKIYKKLLIKVLAIVILATLPMAALADTDLSSLIQPYNQEIQLPYYGSYAGTVTEINSYENKMVYSIEQDGEIIANIIVDENTYIEGSQEIKEGDVIEGFYDMSLPMLLIYPTQFTAEVITVNLPEIQNIKTDRFDGDLVSSDGMLKLNISDETEILLQDGTPFDGDIANRRLAVIYSFTTRSIPAQTAPIKVIVLFEKIMPVAAADNEEASLRLTLNGEILVEGKKIDAPQPYVNENGVVMIPLRAIAEALNYDITWEEATQGVMLNNSISLSIGNDYYTYMRTAPIELGGAPELHKGRTYVPLHFFRDVMKMNNAYVLEGQIIIDDSELML